MAKAKKVKPKKVKPKKGEAVEGEEAAAKPNKLAGLLGGVVGPLVLGASAFGIVYLLPSDEPDAPVEVEMDEHPAEVDYTLTAPKNLELIPLDQITLSARGDNRILRIGLTLEVPAGGGVEISPSDPRLRDAFMGYLRAIEVSQLDEASFLAQLRAQLLRRAQLVFGNESVHGVLITDFLVR